MPAIVTRTLLNEEGSAYEAIPVLQSAFGYGNTFEFTASNEPLQIVIKIFPDALFEAYYIVSDYWSIQKDFTLNIKDGGSDTRMFNTQFPISLVTGDGQDPFLLPVTTVFRRDSTIVLEATNGAASGAHNTFVGLVGARLFNVASIRAM